MSYIYPEKSSPIPKDSDLNFNLVSWRQKGKMKGTIKISGSD
jgi:hypothetical protein